MALKFFPVTKTFIPTFYHPEYDFDSGIQDNERTFNETNQFEALQNLTGIFPGRNYGSFTGYISNDVSRKVYSALIEKYKTLENYVLEEQEVSQMLIYDLFGHSAGLPLNFLKYKQVGFYVSYSVQNDQTRFQLIRNAKVYGFASKLSVLSDLTEPGILEKGSIAILPQNIDSLGLSATDFISFNRNSLWIAVTFGTASPAPKGFKLETSQDFNLYINESSTVLEAAALNQETINSLRKQKTSLTSNTKVPEYIPSFYEKSISVKEIIFKNLPIIKYPEGILKSKDIDIAKLLTPEWMSQFENFLLNILEQLKDERFKFNPKELLKKEYMTRYWLRAFVHETVNAENNLESLETIGDSAINFAVKQMLYNYNHKFKSDQFTNLYKKLTSKKFFGDYSRKIGLAKFAILPPGVDLTISIAEDILEAFAAAMVLAGDEYQNGLGMVLVKNFVHLLMYQDLFGSTKALEALEDNLLNDKVTLIGTDYTNFVGKGSFENSLKTTGDSAIHTVFVTDKGVSNLNRMGFDASKLRRKYASIDEDPKAAKEMANEMLFNDLKRIGLTYEVYEKAKQLKKWSQSPALYKKYEMAKAIAEKKGYKDIIVKIPESSRTLTKMILILIGQKDDKNYNLQVLAHQMDKGSVSEVNRHLATVRLLDNFIEKNR